MLAGYVHPGREQETLPGGQVTVVFCLPGWLHPPVPSPPLPLPPGDLTGLLSQIGDSGLSALCRTLALWRQGSQPLGGLAPSSISEWLHWLPI